MLKKLISFCIIVLAIFSFAGCTKEQKEFDESQCRWYADYTDTLIPRDDYGELFIFRGGYISDKSGYSDVRYGLMTLDGKIVVDPVYTSYRHMTCGDTEYYCMKYTINELYEGGEFYCESTLIKTDGSWMLKLENEIESLSENRIITSKYGSEYTVYDYEGNVIFKGKGKSRSSQAGYQNGILLTYDNVGNGFKDVIAFDENGNKLFGDVAFCEPFYTDKAVASPDYNVYGIISAKGEWLMEPIYKKVRFVDDNKEFHVTVEDTVEVYDNGLNLLRTETIEETDKKDRSEKEYLGETEEYYRYRDNKPDSYIRNVLTDELVICKSNGLPATQMVRTDSENPLFSAVDESNTLWAFDRNGEIFAEHKNAQTMGFTADDFYWLSNEGVTTYFNAETHKKIFSAYSDEEKVTEVYLLSAECDYLCVAELADYHTSQYNDVKYHLYNYKKGEYVFKDCEICTIEEFEGKIFITVVYEDYVTIYDENLKPLMKTKNACKGMTAVKSEYMKLDYIHSRYLSLETKDYTDSINPLIEETEKILFYISHFSGDKQSAYYNNVMQAKDEAMSAFESLLECVFDTGSIGKTLYPCYEYFVVRNLTENVYSTVEGEYTPTLVEYQVSDMFDVSDSEYYNNLVSLKERTDNCTDIKTAEAIISELDAIIVSAKTKAADELKKSYQPMGENVVERAVSSLDKYFTYREAAEKGYTAAAECFENEMFTLKTQLYAKYETAQWLAAIIKE